MLAGQFYNANDPAQRRSGLELGRPVRIGGNVWVGGGSIILPGAPVGEDAIIGAGSVATRDVPAGAAVAGKPVRTVPVDQRVSSRTSPVLLGENTKNALSFWFNRTARTAAYPSIGRQPW